VRGSGTAHPIGDSASETCTSAVSDDSSSACAIDTAGNDSWPLGAVWSGQGTLTNFRTPNRLVERDSGAVSSAAPRILGDADAEVYFSGRGGDTSVLIVNENLPRG